MTAHTASAASAERAVRHEYTKNLPDLLAHLGCTLLISTYQAGKLVVVGVDQGQLSLSYHNFDRAMGVAVGSGKIAVGTHRQVWTLASAPELAAKLPPVGRRDGCFLTRSAHFTGDIQCHELAWADDDRLWLVNTLFSSLCTLEPGYSFVPRWRPRFISALAAEDRCHLNGMAMDEAKPRFVSVLADTDSPGGWREHKRAGGCLIDVASGEIVARGFAMPHSPRLYRGRVLLLDSGTGRLVAVDTATGVKTAVTTVPGYPRGLAIGGQLGFIGLSKIRETSTFDDIPIAAQREQLKCGVAVVDIESGKHLAWLQFHSGVDEIFDVRLLPAMQYPLLSGPYPDIDGQQTIWLAPPMTPS